ncbi:MAG: nitroreductase family protein [bacterium]|nr:nitroreductase family protein [bacterium]
MELEECIISRRSVRSYQDKPVPEEDIQKLLKAGAMAPSAMNKQPVRFIVITNKEQIRELSDKVKGKTGILGLGAKLAERAKVKEDLIFYGAPLLILLVGDAEDWTKIDCALAAQNMMLRGYDLGLGSCYIGFMNLLGDDRETLRSLGVKDDQSLYCPLIFGYPTQWPHPKTRDAKVQKRIE